MDKVIDCVLPEPTTELGAWQQWMNHIKVQFYFDFAHGKRIEVK